MRSDFKLLNLGCGTITPKEWINIDSSWNAWVHKYPIVVDLARLIFGKHAEWVHISWGENICIRDIRKRLPYKNNSIDGIYLSHVIEHLTFIESQKLLQECYRVLKSKKYIRIIVPDLQILAKKYLRESKTNSDAVSSFINSMYVFPSETISFFEKVYFWFNPTDMHKWMYDCFSLKHVLSGVCFSAIYQCKYNESKIPDIDKVEQKSRFIDAVCVEGKKP